MELTLETYRIIVNNAKSRSDIAILCRVSKTLRRVAERALYKTIHLRNPQALLSLASTLEASPQLASLVESMTISPMNLEESEDSEEGGSDEAGYDGQELPEGFWEAIAKALQNTTKLRILNINSQNSSTPAYAGILRNTSFMLQKLHCDFDWNDDLVGFLGTQTELKDLYILDFRQPTTPTAFGSITAPTTSPPSTSMTLNATAMPNLTTLECTFSEAADAIVPHRPVTHLKTCFSRTEINEKREEMNMLFANLSLSTQPIRSLDIADASYNEPFAMELLRKIADTKVTRTHLLYLGTLVLPIGGQERLRFYGLLMRLPSLRCIEVEVSEWAPPPASIAAYRALASELRLYCSTITSVVFVLDFERTLVTVANGACIISPDAGTDFLWREA